MEHSHTPSFKTDVFTWLALMLLTAVTVFVAKLTGGNTAFAVAIALAIATVKATVVLLYFMHVKWDNFLYKIFIAIVIFLFLAFEIFMVVDYAFRT